MVTDFSVRAVENGFIVAWTGFDSHGEVFHSEKIFLSKTEMEPFIAEMIMNLRIN